MGCYGSLIGMGGYMVGSALRPKAGGTLFVLLAFKLGSFFVCIAFWPLRNTSLHTRGLHLIEEL